MSAREVRRQSGVTRIVVFVHRPAPDPIPAAPDADWLDDTWIGDDDHDALGEYLNARAGAAGRITWPIDELGG